MTGPQGGIGPLVVEFDVATNVEHAFTVWVDQLDRWWPKGKTVSGDDLLRIILEPTVGGRIYELGRDGDEHDWGRIVAWEPPTRLAFMWHLFFDPSEATDVSITFRPSATGTAVRLEHTGWDRLGQGAEERRTNTILAWDFLMARYRDTFDDNGLT